VARARDIKRSRFAPESWRPALEQKARQLVRKLGGAALIATFIAATLALLSYDAGDPSLNLATSAAPRNWLGGPGAGFADLALQWLGLAGALLALPLATWGYLVLTDRPLPAWRLHVPLAFAGAILIAWALGVLPVPYAWSIRAGLGGAVGNLGHHALALGASAAGWAPLVWVLAALIGLTGLGLLIFALGLERSDWAQLALSLNRAPRDDDDAATDDGDDDAEPVAKAPRVKALRGARTAARRPATFDDDDAAEDDEADEAPPARTGRSAPRVVLPQSGTAAAGRKGATRAQQQTLALGDGFELPALDLLATPTRQESAQVDTAALEANARLLETVLDDFGVRGEIAQVRPGPVVTLYELEPAPGIKSSRVIGLSDDIARSMSAIAARVAVVPGRNVIGIELPNRTRETVFLRELLAAKVFANPKSILPMALGKDISGEPVVVDLAPMPHLLIAGTTGSGKSVGLNAMILSLLYRLPPEKCRFIMIDPKMLELSVYDGIPHLLAPVVTEPKKAIVALKWAVKEMDARYRKMSNLGVRNLAAFNERVGEAKARGRELVRRVHTGYDRASGEPIYEEQTFDFEPMPLIVVVVDELADLMMVAGKEIEVLVQRLAQKARAAGIHLIMATQRPSVDVITGVIKANLPTRISFQVTSKIDSRTILGEQGAEQLLGKGDQLFMTGGKQIIRVHGPFVSDEEVERVADHWRRQGAPDYIEAVTEEEEEDGGPGLDGGDAGDADADLYRRAVQVVAESQKASTSFIQRQLRIGYNSAARLIEQMEKQGLVSEPDHVGRREVLLERDGARR